MYLPKHFEERDPERLRSFIQRYPLGSLITATESGLDANHIPFVFADTGSAAGTLHGHIARANPLWREGVRDAAALVIFQGPNSFISPSWYPSKRENARVVPTWNYAVVHVHGVLRFVDDPAWVRSHVEALTREHEGKRDPPWAVTDAPAGLRRKDGGRSRRNRDLHHAAGGQMEGKSEWSISDRVGVVEALEREATPSGAAIAALIRETLDDGD